MDFKIKNFTASPSFYLREVKGLENSLELDRAVRFLNENPVAKIEINTTYKIVVPDTSITTTTDSLATDSSAIKPVVAPPVESEETKNIQNYLLKKGINANRITLRRIDVAEDKDVNKIAIKIKN